MAEHPIEGMMITAMNSIKDMIDVNTIIGEPIETSNNIVIIPISKVSFGFAAGGSEFKGETIDEYTRKEKEEEIQYRLPFGGGSGAGVSINPIAFLVVQENIVKLLPVNYTSTIEKLLDYIPDLLEKTNTVVNKTIDEMIDDKKEKREEKKKEEKPEVKKEKKEDKKKEETEYEYEYTEEMIDDDE